MYTSKTHIECVRLHDLSLCRVTVLLGARYKVDLSLVEPDPQGRNVYPTISIRDIVLVLHMRISGI